MQDEDQNGATEPEGIVKIPWRPLVVGFLLISLAFFVAYQVGADLPIWKF